MARVAMNARFSINFFTKQENFSPTMKKFTTYLAWFAAAIGMTGVLTACQDDVDAPSAQAPVAENQANISILDLKKTFWDDADNYIYGMENKENAEKVAVPAREDGSHYIIKGVVVSSDEASNVFKSLVIQDETAAIALSINSYNLYLNYRMGQEVVIDVTGMYIGKYNGLLQLGYPEWYERGAVWEASFMAPEIAKKHVELNGWPNAAAIDTLEINNFSELPSNPEGLMKYQSQLVKFKYVEFQNAGTETFSTYHSSGVNQSIIDSEGASLPVRTSGYSNFWNKTLPTGKGDVVCILSYYGTTGWQLILNDYEGCMNFGSAQAPAGVESNPYNVDEAVAFQTAGTAKPDCWVYGYIVGAVAPEVETVKSNDDIEWTANPVLDNTIVIGMTPDTKDLAHALVVELPYGSTLAQYGNLVSHPENYGKRIDLQGALQQVLGSYGMATSGANGTWKIEGVTVDDGSIPNGNGTKENPYSAAQVISGAASGTAWVKGYIVGWVDGMNLSEGAKFTATATSASNILISAEAGCTDVSKCIPVQLPYGDIRTAVNLQAHPENFGKTVAFNGSIEKYFGTMGVKTPTEYVLGDGGGGTVNPPQPTEAVTSLDEGFSGGAIPSNWSQVQVAGDKTWYTPSYQDNYYAAMTGYKGTAPFDQWLLTPAINIAQCSSKVLTFETQVNGYGSTTSSLEVYVLNDADPAKATVKDKLNATLATAPASGYSSWVASGNLDLSKYTGNIYIGFRYYATQDANYATWCVDNVKLNAGGGSQGGGDEPNPPVEPSGEFKGDFNTFNGGEPKASPYGEYTNATGWTATNCIILSGDDDASKASNPYFGFIGKAGTLAPTLNGKVGAAGTLTSPVLTGGCGTLTFNYGFAFTEAKAQFTVNIKDASGNIVKTDTVTLDSITKLTAMTYSLDVNVSGSFIIEIVNNSYSQASGNKDRVSIWNLTWTEQK